jgi:hypothetical protein
MGGTWQTPDQKAFIEGHLPCYAKHSESGTLNSDFWPDFLDKWFEKWPQPEPAPGLVEKEGSTVKAAKAERGKKVSVSTM